MLDFAIRQQLQHCSFTALYVFPSQLCPTKYMKKKKIVVAAGIALVAGLGVAALYSAGLLLTEKAAPAKAAASPLPKPQAAPPVNSQVKPATMLGALDDVSVLRFALQLQDGDASAVKVVGKTLVNAGEVQQQDAHYPTTISRSITVSGASPDSRRYVALIQTAEELAKSVDDPNFFIGMEVNSYQCSLLVLSKQTAGWSAEYFDEVSKSEYSGSTRSAKACGDGYQLGWDASGRPVLSGKEELDGPFDAGIWTRSVSSIAWKQGKYVLSSQTVAQGELDEIEKVKAPAAGPEPGTP
jgi:hypothetical protein